MLIFKQADLLPVLTEAASHKCKLILVKDHGVYFISEKGEMIADPEGRKHIAYAQGCNPNVDQFDDWWERGISEMGGDDCAEYFDISDGVFQRVLAGGHELHVKASQTSIEFVAVPAAS
jgi:hypothetical protein